MPKGRSSSTIDIRDRPLYARSDAARYLGIPVATVSSWIVGRHYPLKEGEGFSSPLIRLPADDAGLLSFNNLIELHVLRSLRVDHVVPLRHVRTALAYAEANLGLERLLIRQDLRTFGGIVFLERFGELIALSRSGQLAIRRMLDDYLRRVDWDACDLPTRLFPFVGHSVPANGSFERPIVIDPRVSFGQPLLVDGGVSTGAIVRRIDLGEDVDHVAVDYGITPQLVELAIVFEKAA